jgi:hypothetical protein
MVELSGMDVTMAARIELVEPALRAGTGSVTGPGAVSASALVRGTSRRDPCRDLGRQPR